MIRSTLHEVPGPGRRPSPGHGAAFAAASAVFLAATTTLAQPTDGASAEARANVLFKEGRKLVKEGDYDAGCPKLEASLALLATTSTMLNVAKCHEHAEKLATAWEEYQQALAMNSETQPRERRDELEQIGRQSLLALEPRLSRLRVVIANAPAGVVVLRDGRKMESTRLGEALPVDRGNHEVVVSAPGYEPERRSILVEAGKTRVVEISLRRVSGAAGGGAAGGGAAGGGAVGGGAAGRWVTPTGITLVAAGAVGLGAGVVTGILSLQEVAAIKSRCGGMQCPSEDMASRDDVRRAKTLGNVSTGALIAGGVLATAGVVLLVLPKGSKGNPLTDASSKASARIVVSPFGATLQGEFQ